MLTPPGCAHRFVECLETYGAKVDQVTAPVGDRPSQEQIAEALSKKKYKLLTLTHVDTCASFYPIFTTAFQLK
jgi:aspartate aminotransferase-like enzyme